MTNNPSPLQQITVSGSPREVGKMAASSSPETVALLLADLHENYSTRLTAEESVELFSEFRAKMLGYLETHFPGEVEEMYGVAEGAGISEDDAILMSFGPSLREVMRDVPHNCSSIAWGSAAQGPTLFKTDDGPAYDREQPIKAQLDRRIGPKRVFDVKSGDALRVLGINDVGRVLTETGVNEAGLAMGSSSGRPVLAPQDGHGVPQHMFANLVLRYCRNVDEAIAFAHKHPVSGKGINIAVADAAGNLAAIDKCGKFVGVRRSRDFAFAVNHYLNPDMLAEIERQIPDFIGSKYHRNSDGRRAFLEARLPRMAAMDDADPDDIVATLFEHSDAGSVCQHMGENDLGTNFAARIRPVERTVDIWHGPPCLGDLCSYGFSGAATTPV